MTMNNGTLWTDVTSQINSTGYVRVNVPAATITDPVFGFRIVTSGDSIAVDFTQIEQRSTVSTPKITTTVTRGLGAEMHSFNDDGSSYNDGQRLIDTTHYNGRPLSQYMEFSGNFDGATIAIVKGGGNLTTSRVQIAAAGTGTLNSSGNSVSTANTVTTGWNNINRITTRTNGGGGSICLNAGAIATNSLVRINTTDATDDHLGIGNRGDGTQGLNGYIRRLTFWRRELTDGEMIELTR
jgi:hypothetical protein